MRRSAAVQAASGRQDRRKVVEAALAEFARMRPVRRAPPPDGRLGADDYPIQRLRLTLADLGPVFASFGRYLSTRPDLLPRRDCRELAAIADIDGAADPAAVAALVHRQLGAPPARRFFQFDPVARDVGLWTERHQAWVAPGVPVMVTIVRPDAAAWLDQDLPLLPLLQRCLAIGPAAFAAAVDDFADTLRARLDQRIQATSLAALSADAASARGFDAPACYRDHCAAGVLTVERCEGPTLADAIDGAAEISGGDRATLGRRLASAWLRQALAGHVVPFDFAARDIVLEGPRLVLTAAAFEPHSTAARTRFSRYVNAVAADDPDAAAAWIVDAAGASETPAAVEEELKRRFRQAVPFRDGEWSGDDRLAEQLLVQWRATRDAGCRLLPHHLHVYRGALAVETLLETLAPDEDLLLGALQDERLRLGFAEAVHLVDPRALQARLDTALQEMVTLPQRLDEVLTLASEGRLRVRLQVPENDGSRRARHQTVLLVASLVVLMALASLLRHMAPAYGPVVEQVGVVALLVVGGWLVVAAARW
jgi:predicted unusual protein kinase regulating ubiquinone biosynthesis (AarF/ABC1/UbiB family)